MPVTSPSHRFAAVVEPLEELLLEEDDELLLLEDEELLLEDEELLLVLLRLAEDELLLEAEELLLAEEELLELLFPWPGGRTADAPACEDVPPLSPFEPQAVRVTAIAVATSRNPACGLARSKQLERLTATLPSKCKQASKQAMHDAPRGHS